MAIPNHYQQGFQTCNYQDTQEKVDTTVHPARFVS